MSQLLEATPLTDEQKGLLEMLRLSSDNLLRILTDLVDYTRIGSGKFRLEISSVDLDEFAGNIAPVMEMMAREKGLDFRMKRGGPGVTLMTDRDRISQIIFNLVNNSVKYTREGYVTLDVHYNNSLVISVSDTGVGIPPDKMKEIFKPFTQIKGEGEAKNRGLGLGLSIVRLIVKMMDGTIDVVSKPGMGSTFTVKIPCVARFDENTISASDEVLIEEDRTAAGTISVLIVEDEVINRIFLERILAKRGFVIDSALNGRECLEKYRTGNYDLIFMDINMPEIDGFEAVSLIREEERFNGRSRIPVIAVTAHVYPDDIKKCMDAGMDSYIAKPYDTMKLMEEIIKVCSKAKQFIRNNYPRN
jgi:CheY-like chemotaxis protein